MKDDGSGRKIAVHAIIGGIMSQITGAGFASGAVGADLNEALINAVKGKDPSTAQIVSAILGAAAAKVAGGNALAGASAAAAGTKWNLLSEADYNEMRNGVWQRQRPMRNVKRLRKSMIEKMKSNSVRKKRKKKYSGVWAFLPIKLPITLMITDI